MKIDINALRFNRYSIIYGLSDAERSEMTEQILASNPEYRLKYVGKRHQYKSTTCSR